MEEKPLCYASARILFWKLSVAANTIQSNKDVCVHAFSVSAKAENCISLYSSESASSGRGLGCIFSGTFFFSFFFFLFFSFFFFNL